MAGREPFQVAAKPRPSGNLIAMRTSGKSYDYTSDAQGSDIALTDSTQALDAAYTYDAWGNTTSTGPLAATNPWTYATGYHDAATGYLKLGARYYNPTTGRFTQPDPSGQETNAYNYASGDPINQIDPTGTFSIKDIATGIGIIGGVVITYLTASITVPVLIVGLVVAFTGGVIAGCGMTDAKFC